MKALFTSLAALMSLLMSLSSCFLFPQRALNESDVQRYLTAYDKLRGMGTQFSSPDGTEVLQEGQAGYELIESAITSSGFASYQEFVEVNGAIAVAISVIQGREFMGEMGESRQNVMTSLPPEVQAQLNEVLTDPNNTPEFKAAFEKQLLESVGTAQSAFNAEFDKNAAWANPVLNAAESLSSNENLELVKRYLPQLLEVYAGQ